MNNYLVIDLEATCCNKNSFPRNEMEIIEIGAVLAEGKTFDILSEFQSFVQPVRTPELTAFCTELTTIRQEQVQQAPVFGEAFDNLLRWTQNYQPMVFCSWGDYDRRQFQQDCAFHQVEYKLPHRHLNLKKRFSERQGLRRKLGMAGALRKVGLPLEGTHHRGLDDARNIARLLPYCRLGY